MLYSNGKADTIPNPTRYRKQPGRRRGDAEATADAGLPVTGCGTPSCYRGCYTMAQILTFLTGVSLGDRCRPSWRCLSLILGHPVTHWDEGTKAQVGQILLQGPLQRSPAIRLRLALTRHHLLALFLPFPCTLAVSPKSAPYE